MASSCDFEPILSDIYEAIGNLAAPPDFDASAIESRLSDLENRISALEPQLPIIQANALAGMTAGQAAMAAIAGLAATMAAIEARGAIAESLARQAQQQALQAIGASGQAINMAGNAQNTASQLGGQLRNLGSQVSANAGKIAGLLGRVAGLAAAIAGIGALGLAIANRNAISGLRDSLSSLSGRVRDVESDSAQNARDIGGLGVQVGALRSALQAQVQRLEDLIDGRINAVMQQANVIRSQVAKNTADIAKLFGMIGAGALDGANGLDGLNGLRERVNSLGSQVGSLGRQIGSLNQKTGKLENEVDSLRTGLGRTSSTANEANSRSKLNARDIAGILGTLAALGVAVAALQARKLMCRYNEVQVQAAATAAASAASATAALQALMASQVIPWTMTTTKTLATMGIALDAVKNGVTSGFKWLVSDRVINIVNLVSTLHNATFLSRDIGETLFGVADTVLAIMGKQLKDSEGETIEVGELLSARLESAITSAIGSKAYAELLVRWQKFSTIYTSAANMLGSIRNIQDSIISGVEVAAGNSAKVGNALQKYGVISENATNWMSENPNFDSPLLMKLEKAESIASSLSSVTSDVRDIQEESNEFKEQREELKARLASKDPEDGSDWSFDAGVESELAKQRDEATRFENVSLDDVKP